MNREEPSRNGPLYETRPGTWIAGAVVGVVLSFGLIVAGDRYVRTAKNHAGGETAVAAKRTAPERVASTRDPFDVNGGCDLDTSPCIRKCVAC